MGTTTTSAPFALASEVPAVSRGGKRRHRLLGTVAMSASYATGGDTISAPTGYGTLKMVNVSPTIKGGYALSWDGGAATPKLQAYDIQDATASNLGDEAAASADLSALTGIVVELIFEQ